MQMKLLEITSVYFDQIFSVHQIPEKSGSIMVRNISYLSISRKPMIHLGGM
jgi:hypothetical protein